MKKNSKRERRKIHKHYINKILKILSYAMILSLVVLGVFFSYYFISLKIYEKNPLSKLPKFGLYTIVSGSMEPNIKVYDVVVDLNIFDPNKIKKGDVITFVSNSNVSKGLTVTHRVINVIDNANGTKSYMTKGDNNMRMDTAPVNSEDILGKVLFKIPQLGRIQFLLVENIGLVMLILLPALGVIIYDFIKLFKLLSFNSKFMRYSHINDKIETNINVEDLNQLQNGLLVVKKFQQNEDKI